MVALGLGLGLGLGLMMGLAKHLGLGLGLMQSEQKILRILQDLAEIAALTPKVANYKLAAALEYKNRIVAYGTSSYKSSPFQKKYADTEHRIFLHAEIATIKNALRQLDLWQLKKSSLYICRVKNKGVWGISKPCDGCQRAIAEFEIKNVYYTVDNGYETL
jgi:tRNA(Arg) A34 adenosine deaminase TadA